MTIAIFKMLLRRGQFYQRAAIPQSGCAPAFFCAKEHAAY